MPLALQAGRLAALAALVLAPGLAAAQGVQAADVEAADVKAGDVQAGDVKAGDLVIQHPWARATPNGAQVAGGYLTITNRGTAADTLTGGSAAVATKFELHDMTTENGIMRMRPTGPLAIPPGGTVTLSPSGRHIMLTGLKHGLTKGDTIEGTLTFAHAGTVPVRFEVEGIGARAPADASIHSMPGMKME